MAAWAQSRNSEDVQEKNAGKPFKWIDKMAKDPETVAVVPPPQATGVLSWDSSDGAGTSSSVATRSRGGGKGYAKTNRTRRSQDDKDWMEITVSEADRERITRLETELAALRDKNNLDRVTKKE